MRATGECAKETHRLIHSRLPIDTLPFPPATIILRRTRQNTLYLVFYTEPVRTKGIQPVKGPEGPAVHMGEPSLAAAECFAQRA